MFLVNSIALYADRPKINILPFAEEKDLNTKNFHNESEEDNDDAETSGDNLDPDQPDDYVESTKGKRVALAHDPIQKKSLHMQGPIT